MIRFSLLVRLRLVLALAAVPAHGLSAQDAAQRLEILDAAQPQLSVATDGRVWLAYGSGENVFVASSIDQGRSFGPPVKVAQVPQLMLGMRRGPRIVAQGERVTVTVIAHELLAFHSMDTGRTWQGPVVINDVPTCAREGLHDLAISGDGKVFVTWLDLRNGAMELWSDASDDLGRTWGADERVYRSTGKSICECCHPTAVFDAAGHLAVMWRNSLDGARDLWMTTRAPDRAGFATARKLGEGSWALNGCPMDGGRLVSWGEGSFGAVWQREGGIYYSANGGPEQELGRGKQPVAVVQRGELLTLWQQGSALVSLRGSGGGAPTVHASDGRFPSLVSLPDGYSALVAYEQGPGKTPRIVVERLQAGEGAVQAAP